MHLDGFTDAGHFADHYFADVIGNPFDSTVALHQLIFGGVLRDYPNLKLVPDADDLPQPRLFRCACLQALGKYVELVALRQQLAPRHGLSIRCFSKRVRRPFGVPTR